MTNLHSASERADVLRAITAATPRVNYAFKDEFITALREGDVVAAWEAAFNAGVKDGRLEVHRQRFKEWRGTDEKRW